MDRRSRPILWSRLDSRDCSNLTPASPGGLTGRRKLLISTNSRYA
jgi:hypothetical protein